jgi:hypothetical protein
MSSCRTRPSRLVPTWLYSWSTIDTRKHQDWKRWQNHQQSELLGELTSEWSCRIDSSCMTESFPEYPGCLNKFVSLISIPSQSITFLLVRHLFLYLSSRFVCFPLRESYDWLEGLFEKGLSPLSTKSLSGPPEVAYWGKP